MCLCTLLCIRSSSPRKVCLPCPQLSPLVARRLFSTILRLFLVRKWVVWYWFLYFTQKWYHRLPAFSLWLPSHSMIITQCIHVTAKGTISFFSMAEAYSVVYIFMCHIFCIHQSVGGHFGYSLISFSVNTSTWNLWSMCWFILCSLIELRPRSENAGSCGSPV